ncbi:MAG: hypothetical protein ACJ8G3_13815 [Burkholderiaceae bacterium]
MKPARDSATFRGAGVSAGEDSESEFPEYRGRPGSACKSRAVPWAQALPGRIGFPEVAAAYLLPRRLLALLMLCCLLAAQWAGLGHRIAHAGWHLAGPAQVAKVAASGAERQSPAADPTHSHSCAAFDDATLPAALSTPPYLTPLLPGAAVLALWSAHASWQQPFHCHFSSRAPPLS